MTKIATKTSSAKSMTKTATKSVTPLKVWEFVVELMDYKPRMWRRIQVLESTSLEDLAYIVMASFWCSGGHLYQIRVGYGYGETLYALPCPEDWGGVPTKDITGVKMGEVFKNPKDCVTLEYDFGDGWEFKIQLEKTDIIADKKESAYPFIVTGKGYGIVDDIGGVGGLEDLAEQLKSGELDEGMLEWLSGVLSFEFDGSYNFLTDLDIDWLNDEGNQEYLSLREAYHMMDD